MNSAVNSKADKQPATVNSKVDECPGHEAKATPFSRAPNGWYPAECKHCGMDMTPPDSGG